MPVDDVQSAGMGGLLPSQTGNAGLVLVTDGEMASWDSVPGSGVTTMTAVGSSPNNDGATISGADLTLQPADATHPGVVIVGAQNLGDTKTIGGVLIDSNAGGGIGDAGIRLNADVAGLYYASGNVVIYAAGDIAVKSGGGFATVVNISLLGTTLDLTGLGNGASIKLKSPDGTTYTATIANGGTWNIA